VPILTFLTPFTITGNGDNFVRYGDLNIYWNGVKYYIFGKNLEFETENTEIAGLLCYGYLSKRDTDAIYLENLRLKNQVGQLQNSMLS
jgi:hypothetical protein